MSLEGGQLNRYQYGLPYMLCFSVTSRGEREGILSVCCVQSRRDAWANSVMDDKGYVRWKTGGKKKNEQRNKRLYIRTNTKKQTCFGLQRSSGTRYAWGAVAVQRHGAAFTAEPLLPHGRGPGHTVPPPGAGSSVRPWGESVRPFDTDVAQERLPVGSAALYQPETRAKHVLNLYAFLSVKASPAFVAGESLWPHPLSLALCMWEISWSTATRHS